MIEYCMFIQLSTSFSGGAVLVVPHCVQEDVKQADEVGGSSRVLRVELNAFRQKQIITSYSILFFFLNLCERQWRRSSPEDGLGVVYDALVGVIVGVGEEDVPAIGQRVRVDGEAVILAGDEAAVRPLVDARLVVATVAVPERLERKRSKSHWWVSIAVKKIYNLVAPWWLLYHSCEFSGFAAQVRRRPAFPSGRSLFDSHRSSVSHIPAHFRECGGLEGVKSGRPP